MRALTESGHLDPGRDCLPDESELTARQAAGQGMVWPELAVLMASTKNAMKDELQATAVAEGPWFIHILRRYFVSYRPAAGEERSLPLAQVETAALFRVSPWRTFRWYCGQKHCSGTYWCATLGDHVIYESRLELETCCWLTSTQR